MHSSEIRMSMKQTELFLVVLTFEYLNQMCNTFDIRHGELNQTLLMERPKHQLIKFTRRFVI